MASSRIFSLRSVDQLAVAGCKQQLRRLHITEVNATPSSLLNSEITGAYLPRNITDLRTECSNRSLNVHGGEAEVN